MIKKKTPSLSHLISLKFPKFLACHPAFVNFAIFAYLLNNYLFNIFLESTWNWLAFLKIFNLVLNNHSFTEKYLLSTLCPRHCHPAKSEIKCLLSRSVHPRGEKQTISMHVSHVYDTYVHLYIIWMVMISGMKKKGSKVEGEWRRSVTLNTMFREEHLDKVTFEPTP